MPAKKAPKPEPVSLNIVCSICDEPWHLHKEINGEVSTLECVRLLKAKRYTPTITVLPRPYVQPYVPYYPTYPVYGTITVSSSTGQGGNTTSAYSTLTTTNTATPTVALASAAA